MECNPIIPVQSVRGKTVYLGVFTTFNAKSVIFDFSTWADALGDGTFSVSLLRPGESVPYNVADVTVDGTRATWTFDAADTAIAGYGRAFLAYATDDALDMTVDFDVYIAQNSAPAGDTPPDPLESWYQRMLDAAAQAQNAALTAQRAAEGIQDMTATAHGVTGDPTVDKTVSEEGIVNLDFGIPDRGGGLPSGGTPGQYLVKRTAASGDAA